MSSKGTSTARQSRMLLHAAPGLRAMSRWFLFVLDPYLDLWLPRWPGYSNKIGAQDQAVDRTDTMVPWRAVDIR